MNLWSIERGVGTELQNVWVSQWGPPQRLVYGLQQALFAEKLCLGAAAPSNSLSKLTAKNLLCNSQLFVILKKRLWKSISSVGVIMCQKMPFPYKGGRFTKHRTLAYLFHVPDF